MVKAALCSVPCKRGGSPRESLLRANYRGGKEEQQWGLSPAHLHRGWEQTWGVPSESFHALSSEELLSSQSFLAARLPCLGRGPPKAVAQRMRWTVTEPKVLQDGSGWQGPALAQTNGSFCKCSSMGSSLLQLGWL